MPRPLTIAFVAAGLASLPSVAPAMEDVGQHMNYCAGVGADGIDWCKLDSAEFRSDYPKAFGRDYQAQRNVAFCFDTGCNGAVIAKRSLACAWRIVILASGSPRVDDSDHLNWTYRCGRKALDDMAFATAVRQARGLFAEIYGEALPPAFERR